MRTTRHLSTRPGQCSWRSNCRDVVREYRVGDQSVRALDEISLRLRGRALFSVVGPSGAGKSTLLHLLGALDSPIGVDHDSSAPRSTGSSDDQQSEFRTPSRGLHLPVLQPVADPDGMGERRDPETARGCSTGQGQTGRDSAAGPGRARQPDPARPAELSGGQIQRVASRGH